MNDLVQEATQVLIPLLSSGADAAAKELTQRAGKSVAGLAVSVADRIRGLFGAEPKAPEVERTLRWAVDQGMIQPDELQQLASAATSIRSTNAIGVVEGNFYGGNVINVTGTFNG